MLLAIDTATASAGVALWAGGAPVASALLVGARRHAELLMPTVDELFRRAGITVADLDALAVDIGPGLFTGLRVGLATATAISLARGVPAVGVTSLHVLAYPHRRCGRMVAPVVDARRGEVFWALYEADAGNLRLVLEPSVAPPGMVAQALAGLEAPVLAVGDGAWRYRDQFAPVAEVGGPGEMWPSPDVLAQLGLVALAEGPAPGGPPQPLYLRQADVRVGWDQMDGRVGEARPVP